MQCCGNGVSYGLRIIQACSGHALVMCWVCIQYVAAMFWTWFLHGMEMFGVGVGYVLAMCWPCVGKVSGMC